MKVLSVKVPWAYYLAAGIKDVENRSWNTSYRGPFAIHASGDPIRSLVAPNDSRLPLWSDYFKIVDAKSGEIKKDKSKYWVCEKDRVVFSKEFFGIPALEREFALFDWCMQRLRDNLAPMPTQAIIGIANLVDVVRDSKSPWSEVGQYHWIIENPCLFAKPVLEIKGALGLWSYEGSLPTLKGG